MTSHRLPERLKLSTPSYKRQKHSKITIATQKRHRHLNIDCCYTTPHISRGVAAVKRAIDLTIAIPTAVLFPLILIPVAIAIKIDSRGPVFFTQKRSGRHGKIFTCLKFRTLRHNPNDTSLVIANDPRISRLGHFLRKTSIDELPQIFNVISGSMSIVGPRPHIVELNEYYTTLLKHYDERHEVKPGLTGWAQINGWRGPTDKLWKMRERLNHDLWYIHNYSLWLDLKIILRTFRVILHPDTDAF